MNLLRFFRPIVYIKLHPDMITVREAGTAREFNEPPVAAITRDPPRQVTGTGDAAKSAAASTPVDLVNPFKHPRALLSDFTLADQIVKGQMRKLLGKRSSFVKPIVVLHPQVDPEGGFTHIEIRALQELPRGAGASSVFVWHGRDLSDEQLLKLQFDRGGELLI